MRQWTIFSLDVILTDAFGSDLIEEALGWDRTPRSLHDVFDNWIPLGEEIIIISSSCSQVFSWGYGMLGTRWGWKTNFQCHLMRCSINFHVFAIMERILLQDQDARFLEDKVGRMKA